MKEIYLIRHGQSMHHTARLTGGWTDTPLTALGCRQAELTSTRLAALVSEDSFHIYSSDLIRASKTAEIIARHVGAEITLDADLRELNNGIATGLTEEEAKKVERPITQPTLDWIPYPEAESWRMMTERIFKCMDRLSADPYTTALIVSHGNSGIAIIEWWLRLSEASRDGISFELDPCNITHLGMNRYDERTVVRLNDTSHLQGLEEA